MRQSCPLSYTCNVSATLAADKIYLFGGIYYNGLSSGGFTSEAVIQFDLASGTFEVVLPKETPDWLSPRHKHAAAFAEWRKEIIFYGGKFERVYVAMLQDTVAFDVESKTWSRLVSKGTLPEYGEEHWGDIVGKRMYVFGRAEDPFRVGDLSQEKYVIWSTPKVTGMSPGRLETFSFNALPGNLVVFGGGSYDEEEFTMCSFRPRISEWKSPEVEENQKKKPGQHVTRMCGVSVHDGVIYVTNMGIFKADIQVSAS